MTKKDIIKRTLLHEKTAQVPYYIKCSSPVQARLEEHFGVEDIGQAVGNYLVSFSPGSGQDFQPRQLDEGHYEDEFGCLWQATETNIGQIIERPLKTASLDGYTFPKANDTFRIKGLKEITVKHKDEYLVANITNHTLLERAFNLRGMPHFMTDMYDHPRFVEELLDRILEYDWGLTQLMLDCDVDAVKINDDWGDQRGVFIGQSRWRSLIKPRIAELCRRIRQKKDVDIFLHSDGNISGILPDIIELGITAVNPMQPEVMDIFDLKKRFGDRITFFGGMNTQRTMPFGSPDDVVAEMRELVRVLSVNGGFILAPGLIVLEDVPMENILAFIRVCLEQTF